MYNPFSLEGKTILVTGASSGIGKTTAIECSKMGANVIITGRNEKRLKETFDNLEHDDRNNTMIIADLRDEQAIDCLVAQLPALNGVALCAGIGITTPVSFSTPDKFRNIMETNVYSPVELIRMIAKKRKLAKQSSVVAIASVGGVFSIDPGNGVYGASKAALNAFSKFMALEMAPKQIRVNTVCPGTIETPMVLDGVINGEDLEAYKSNYPLKRFGQPRDVAFGIIYLLSDASSWVTGTSLTIDGGLTI